MINKLWTGINLENYNNWYPLTGKIAETPQQYINTWPNVNDWFTTFAIRAQNDINAYLNFILSKFPFDSFKDELIKETLRDMVYVCIEHWVFNRTPIEFNIDATIQFNNGNQFSANSIPTINVWDLAPSRMKIWARLTQLKQVFLDYNEDELDIEKIDLKAFYTRNQVDELIKEQKAFTLSKQMKLYDDLIDDNENEIYRGPVTNFINKGYVATEYDPKTETMILDWPDEIGTLPPEALQNNPQVGDFTHAATADFSAKQQKRITTNENNIKLIENKVDINKQNIDDIKNNWFNIETSPLWKKWSVFISSGDFEKWYFIEWYYIYQFSNNPRDNYTVRKIIKFNLAGNINQTTQKEIILDKLILNDNVVIILFFDKNNYVIDTKSNNINYLAGINLIYQYQGINTPTEFITEDNNDNDYYTKQETDNLLDKKQNITDDDLQTIAKQIVPAINENKTNIDKKQDKLNANVWINIDNNNNINIDEEGYANKIFTFNGYSSVKQLETDNKTIIGAINELKTTGGNVDKNLIFNNKDDKDNTTRLVSKIITTNVGGKTLIYRNLPNVTDDKDIPNKKYVDDAITDVKNIIEKLVVWKTIGERIDDRTWSNFSPSLKAIYRVFLITETSVPLQNGYKEVIFFTPAIAIGTGTRIITSRKIGNTFADLKITYDNTKWTLTLVGGDTGGAIYKLEELKAEDIYEIKSATLDIKKSDKMDITKPLNIISETLKINSLAENTFDIELKENPIPPTPNIPQWKEVGTREKNQWNNWQITYDFIENKKYRIYYSWSIYNPVYTIKEFIITDKRIAGVPLETFNNNTITLVLSVNHAKFITIYSLKGTDKGNTWKLEELQE